MVLQATLMALLPALLCIFSLQTSQLILPILTGTNRIRFFSASFFRLLLNQSWLKLLACLLLAQFGRPLNVTMLPALKHGSCNYVGLFKYYKGAKLNAVSANHATAIELNVAVANKPMYGAGRSMQDMLDSARGLPLILRLSLKTDFHVVGSLIRPKFHHEAKCLLVLHNSYDKNHTNQSYNSTCFVKRSY